jgi:hypothetical protein
MISSADMQLKLQVTEENLRPTAELQASSFKRQ